MTEWQAYITEGKTDRTYSMVEYGLKPAAAAQVIIADANVRDGAEVLMGYMMFDYPSKSFTTVQFSFDVVDGEAKNLTTIKA